MIIEACVENFEEAFAAVKKGAKQIELCSHLDQDGLTPDLDIAKKCLKELPITTKVMIRPRAGHFMVDEALISQMAHEIQLFNEAHIFDIVLGLTEANHTLAIDAIKGLASINEKNSITIHKAIDTCMDPISEIMRLKEINNVDYILTSGKAAKAEEALDFLLEMKKACGKEISLIACGKITHENLLSLDQVLQLDYYHGRKIVGNL